jgi:hypothetical protein
VDDCGDNTDEIGCESSSTTEKGGKSFNVGSDTKHQCKNKIQWNFDSSNSDEKGNLSVLLLRNHKNSLTVRETDVQDIRVYSTRN